MINKEYTNIQYCLELIQEILPTQPNFIRTVIEFIYCREILSLCIETDFLLKWYTTIKEYIDKLQLKNEAQYSRLVIDCTNEIGVLSARLNNVQVARPLFEQAGEDAKTFKYFYGQGEALLNIGKLEVYDTDAAIDKFRQALEIAIKNNEKLLEAKCYEGVGLGTWVNKPSMGTIDCFQKSIAIYKAFNMKHEESAQTLFLGNSFYSLKMYQQALEQYEIAIQLLAETYDPSLEGEIYYRIALTAKYQEEYNKALLYMEKFFELKR